MSGRERGTLMMKFADLLEQNKDELAQLETLDNGKPLAMSAGADIPLSIEHYRYMAGYADKIFGRTIQVSNGSFHAYTLHEPVGGVVFIYMYVYRYVDVYIHTFICIYVYMYTYKCIYT
jgi:aldehyde dehydrogenase (NAD+)